MTSARSLTMDDQRQLNIFARLEHKENQDFSNIRLPREKYQCGYYYYERSQRYFADTAKTCAKCIVVHNNWIVSVDAKSIQMERNASVDV